VTAADISTALGVTVTTGQPKEESGPLGGKDCYWSTAAAPITWFQLVVRSDDTITAGGEDAAALFAQDKTTFQSLEGWAPLPGVGDQAIIGKDRVLVLKGSVLLDATIGERDPAVATKALTALSTEAAARI
jgi:hypothetical protein